MSYDDWLTEPYNTWVEESDGFMEWCENENIDHESDGAWDSYGEYLEDLKLDNVERYQGDT